MLWLRVEAAAIAVVGFALFGTTGQPWWLIVVLFLVPDLAAAGYVAGPALGAWCYNLTHALALPLALLLWMIADGPTWVGVAAAVWLVHIGVDRALKYGLKYDNSFGCTHLGLIGRSRS